MKRIVLALFSLGGLVSAQVSGDFKFEVLRVRPNLYMFASSLGNVTVQLGAQPGNDGVLVVDTGNGQWTSRILDEIQKLSNQPVRYVISTSADAEHTGGNAVIAKSGKPVAAFTSGELAADAAIIVAQEKVLARMSSARNGTTPDSAAWPGLTFADNRDFYFNGEPIQMFHAAGHTDGDILVFFRNSNVISVGDNFITTGFPVIDLERGGEIQGVVKTLNKILELAIPADNEEGGTMIIPGHGRLCDAADVSDYRDMITIIRDRVADGIKKGKTLAQIKESKPTLEYDYRYGRPIWTGEMFVEAIYKSLMQSSSKAGR
jgi:glyoxylase-like metal-dependent hydrolase (beta-lactamase superfamily II)